MSIKTSCIGLALIKTSSLIGTSIIAVSCCVAPFALTGLGGCKLATIDDTLGRVEAAAGAAERKANEIRTTDPNASLNWQNIIAIITAAGGALIGGAATVKATSAKSTADSAIAKADTAQSHVDDLYVDTHASVARPQTVTVVTPPTPAATVVSPS
jgi:hypothetical protein